MTYNLTSAQTLQEFITSTNTMSAGTIGTPILGYIIALITYIMIFVSMKNYASEHAFLITNIAMLPITLLLGSVGLVNPYLFYVPATIIALLMFINK